MSFRKPAPSTSMSSLPTAGPIVLFLSSHHACSSNVSLPAGPSKSPKSSTPRFTTPTSIRIAPDPKLQLGRGHWISVLFSTTQVEFALAPTS